MRKTGLIVADSSRARIFVVVPEEGPPRRLRLEERASLTNVGSHVKGERTTNRQAGPVHPIGAQRARHRPEHERRFGLEIVKQAMKLTASWDDATIVLIAEPRLLGLMRVKLREALKRSIRLEELAKDYAGLSKAELEKLVDRGRFIQ
jgi:protein required for attachment to host cells